MQHHHAGSLFFIATIALGCAPATVNHPLPIAPVAKAKAVDDYHDLLMTSDDCTSAPKASISRSEAVADVAIVERILRRGWAGFETMQKAGVDFDRLFGDLRSAVAAMPEPITANALQDLLVRRLRVVRDNHMAFFERRGSSWSRFRSLGVSELAYTADLELRANEDIVVSGAAPVGARLVSCEGHATADLLKPSVTDAIEPVRRPIVVTPDPPPALVCRFETKAGKSETLTLAMRRLRVGGKDTRREPAFELQQGAIPLVRLRSLSSGHKTDLDTFAASAIPLRVAKAIVVDVRGNSGGSDSFVADWFSHLTSDSMRYSNIDELHSEVTLQGSVNSWSCELASDDADAKARAVFATDASRAHDDLEAEHERASAAPPRTYKHRAPTEPGDAPTSFTAPLVTLVDKECASSCESFLAYAHQVRSGVVVGENSAGVGVFGEQLQYRLPHSGLGFAAGMKHFYDPDPLRNLEEGRGYMPDLWLDTEDAPKVASAIAACLAGSACPLRDALKRPTR